MKRPSSPASARLRLIPHVHRATHRVGVWLDAHPSGVTQAECHVMAHLVEKGASTVAELHRALAHRRSTLTSVLDRLEDRGFVRRSAAREDRRTFLVELTPAGRKAAVWVHGALADLERPALARVTATELALCVDVLDRIAATPARRARPDAS
jgi:DNA-binding MarR family transcriptional regulator